jgi:hypothetical protein
MRMKGLLAVGAAGATVLELGAYNRAAVIPRAELEPRLPVTPTIWQLYIEFIEDIPREVVRRPEQFANIVRAWLER